MSHLPLPDAPQPLEPWLAAAQHLQPLDALPLPAIDPAAAVLHRAVARAWMAGYCARQHRTLGLRIARDLGRCARSYVWEVRAGRAPALAAVEGALVQLTRDPDASLNPPDLHTVLVAAWIQGVADHDTGLRDSASKPLPWWAEQYAGQTLAGQRKPIPPGLVHWFTSRTHQPPGAAA